jgi:hypothetical protein
MVGSAGPRGPAVPTTRTDGLSDVRLPRSAGSLNPADDEPADGLVDLLYHSDPLGQPLRPG